MVAKGVGGAAELRAWLQAAEARKVAGEGFFEATEETPELAVQERGRGGEQQLSPVQRIKKEIQSDSFVTRQVLRSWRHSPSPRVVSGVSLTYA